MMRAAAGPRRGAAERTPRSLHAAPPLREQAWAAGPSPAWVASWARVWQLQARLGATPARLAKARQVLQQRGAAAQVSPPAQWQARASRECRADALGRPLDPNRP